MSVSPFRCEYACVCAQNAMGPWPMQLVVVMAVRKAVRAATTIFTAISISRAFFMIIGY